MAVNWLAGLLPWRLDITEAGHYTLSEGSLTILAKLEEPVTIKYYRSLGELERSVADLEQALGMSLSEAGAP